VACRGRGSAGELRADLPLESSAQLFFAPLIVFFLSQRWLSGPEWQERSAAFIQELLAVWLDGARPRRR
jgi:hypothetical protein